LLISLHLLPFCALH